MLLQHNVHPVCVFDGGSLPEKLKTEVSRRASRRKNLDKGRLLLKEGNVGLATKCLQKAVDITPAMAAQLIHRIRAECPGAECLVSPYEADSQLAFLSQSGSLFFSLQL